MDSSGRIDETCTSPLTSRAAVEPAPPAAAIPDYDTLHPIGRGRFGQVWLARQKLTGVFCALKIIPRTEVGEIELDGVRMHKQRAPAHPNLVPIEHVGETPECFYYAMELADDARGPGLRSPEGYEPHTLSEELRRQGTLAPGAAADVARQLLDAVAQLHAVGLLHRDIKPANVIRREGRWKLADVGLVTKAGGRAVPAGTPRYAPPEGVVDRTGDLFCVGRVLTEMLTGASPAAGEEAASIRAAVPGDVGRSLSGVVERACQGDASKRFATVVPMRDVLVRMAAPGRRKEWGLSLSLGSWQFRILLGTAAAFVLMVSAVSILGTKVCSTFSEVTSAVPGASISPLAAPMQIRVSHYDGIPVRVIKSRTAIVEVDRPIAEVSVVDADTADVRVMSPHQVQIVPRRVGSTQMLLRARDRTIVAIEIEVIEGR